jgi:hypothetical protein
MKKENYILELTRENYVLKLKSNELQNEIQVLKEKQEKLYIIHANTVLFLQNKLLRKNNGRSLSF